MKPLLIALGLSSATAMAEPIYLQPGQCILIGSQQVCAMQANGSNGTTNQIITYSCRYDKHPGSEVPDLKSYALFQIVTRDNGKKIETVLRDFGMNGKEECEKEAEARSKK